MHSLSFDLNKTKALLVGVGDYQNLPIIKPAIKNIEDLKNILLDKNIIGLSEKNIIPVINKNHQVIYEAFIDFLDDDSNLEIDTLIFYFAGHGIRKTDSKNLYLTGTNSSKETIEISGIPFNKIKRKIESSFIQKRIVILDACYSGLAAMDGSNKPYTEKEINIKGTYVLTSSASHEKSFFDTFNRNTFFTKELVSSLKEGIDSNRPLISLDDIYINIKRKLKHSEPHRSTNLNTKNFFFCYNIAYKKEEPSLKENTFKNPADGLDYKTIRINNIEWMLENFRTKSETEKGVYKYKSTQENSDDERCNHYFNWKRAVELCPEGWQLPSRQDWQEAENFLGSVDKLISNLKIDFCGCRSKYGEYNFFNERAYFWTSDRSNYMKAYHCLIVNRDKSILLEEYFQSYSYSIRYIRK